MEDQAPLPSQPRMPDPPWYTRLSPNDQAQVIQAGNKALDAMKAANAAKREFLRVLRRAMWNAR
jgi:hypothetical protein